MLGRVLQEVDQHLLKAQGVRVDDDFLSLSARVTVDGQQDIRTSGRLPCLRHVCDERQQVGGLPVERQLPASGAGHVKQLIGQACELARLRIDEGEGPL